MKKIVVALLMLCALLAMPGVAFAKTASLYDLPTLPPSLPPVPTELPTLPPDAPTLPPALPTELPDIPDLPEGFDVSDFDFSFSDIIPVFAFYDYTPAERSYAPASFTATVYTVLLGEAGGAQLAFADGDTVTYSAHATLPDPLGNQWSHNSRMSLTYNTQAFLSGEGSFITGSFSQTTTLLDFAFSVSGTVSAQYIHFGSDAPRPALANRDCIMLMQHIDSIQGWPDVPVDNLVCFLDPMDAFIGQVVGAIEQYAGQAEAAVGAVIADTGFPLPASAAQVALGGGITALLMAVSAFAAQGGVVGAAGAGALTGAAQNASQQAAAMAAAAPNAAWQAAQASLPSNPGGFRGALAAVKEFFTQLLRNLRDMLTDEGRSYASGKISEALQELELPGNEE